MKVYVDELPKKCEDCVFSETGFVWDSEVRFCKLKSKCMNWIALYDNKRDDCPLQSLKDHDRAVKQHAYKKGYNDMRIQYELGDYTKQVRKEMYDEIRKKLNSDPSIAEDYFKFIKILDQIQGE